MTPGLHLTIEGKGRSFERLFPRPPVMLGREVSNAHCLLDDPMVSKLHASLDVRDGTICVRDVMSTNGVYVGGRRIGPGDWKRLASANQVGELQIAGWTVRVRTYATDSPLSPNAATISTFVEEEEAAAASSRGLLRDERTVVGRGSIDPVGGPDASPATTQFVDRTLALQDPQEAPEVRALIAQLPSDYVKVIVGLKALYETTSKMLASAPRTQRPSICQGLGASYPLMLTDASFVAMFRHHGWTPASQRTLEGSALEAMQDLARWYMGTDRTLANSDDIRAFKEKLRTSLDELVSGFVPLVSGLNQFEHEMALRQEGTSGPRSPAEMARALLDWTDRRDDVLRRVRASFADLMMHQVALLNGVMRGVMALLTELAPAMIEKSAARKAGRTFFLLRLFRRTDPWSLYKERHNDLTSEEHERFRLLFGADFAAEYRQFAREARSTGSEAPPALKEPGTKGSLPPAPGGPWDVRRGASHPDDRKGDDPVRRR